MSGDMEYKILEKRSDFPGRMGSICLIFQWGGGAPWENISSQFSWRITE